MHAPDAPAFLRVDDYLRTELEARALGLALEHGVIDRLAAGPLPEDEAFDGLRPHATGRALLLDLLRGAGVLAEASARGDAALAPAFRAVLPFRDLLEAKLGFAALAAADVQDLLPLFVADLPGFMARARTFELFRYDRCLSAAPENVALARRWVGYTTALTRYEAGPLLDAVEEAIGGDGLAGCRALLDVGGNSGEFARRACARAPGLAATVLDLPAVCAIGRDHLSGSEEAARVRFRPGDMRRDPLPAGHDLVTFKSVLHDWPDAGARDILSRACAALPRGGQIAVVERAPFRVEGAPTYAGLANLVFLPFLRPPDLYREVFAGAGLVDVATRSVALETPFQLVTARRP